MKPPKNAEKLLLLGGANMFFFASKKENKSRTCSTWKIYNQIFGDHFRAGFSRSKSITLHGLGQIDINPIVADLQKGKLR